MKQVHIHPRDRLARATKNAQRNDDDIEFIKQVPMHPRDRLARATKNAQRDDDDVEFIKHVPMHPRDRLARTTKNTQGDDNVKFIKQVPEHPRDRLRRKTKTLKHSRDRMRGKELKIARENVSALMRGKFVFDPEVFLNKTVLFDTSKMDEEKKIDRILENIPGDNDDIYLIREPGTNAFSLRREGGT